MNMTKNRFYAFGATGLLALSIITGAGVAAAQTTDEGSPSAGDDDGSTPGDSQGHRPHRGFKGLGLRGIVQASGLDGEVFRAGAEEGKTVGEILSENGLDPAAVQADALSALQERLDEAVANGDLTDEEADAKYAGASERLAALMDEVLGGPGEPGGNHGKRGRGLDAAAQAIGIEPAALLEELREGSTIAEVAAANGVDVESVVDAMLVPVFERIDAKVAAGELSAEEATAKKTELTDRLTEQVNTPRPERDGEAGAGFGSGPLGGGPVEISDAPTAAPLGAA